MRHRYRLRYAWRFGNLDMGTKFILVTEAQSGSTCYVYEKIVPGKTDKIPNATRHLKNASELIALDKNEEVIIIKK